MAVHMSTVISRELGHITEHLSKLQPILSQHPLLYTISVSQNTRSSDLSTLVTSLKGLSRRSVGCLSAAVPSAGPSWRQHTSVSLAAFDERYAALFRSTIPGRKATQVGRWHAMHKDAQPDPEEPAHDGSMPDWDTALSQAYDGQALPTELQSLRWAYSYLILKHRKANCFLPAPMTYTASYTLATTPQKASPAPCRSSVPQQKCVALETGCPHA